MCEILEQMCEEAAKEAAEKATDNTRVFSIRSLMENLPCTAQRAFELLRIPEADRPRYLAML